MTIVQSADATVAMARPDPGRKTLVITVASPLTQNIYARIGADELAKHFNVLVMDCFDWLQSYSTRPVFEQATRPNVIPVMDRDAFAAAMRALEPDFLLDFVGRGAATRTLQDECTRWGTLFITHHLTPVPTQVSQQNIWRSLQDHPRATLGKVWRHLWARSRMRRPTAPDIAVVAGSKGENVWTRSAGTLIHAATPCYYDLQAATASFDERKNKLAVPERYILFIDDCLALSFDFMLASHKPIVAADAYFRMLNGFLERVEALSGLPVVVAGHPNGKEFPHYRSLFGGRAVHFDVTAELSLKARAALIHYSSAVAYPVLLRTPITPITFAELRSAPQGAAFAAITATLRRKPLDISEALTDAEIIEALQQGAEEAAYRDYEAQYIISTPSPGRHSFDGLVAHLLTRAPARKAAT